MYELVIISGGVVMGLIVAAPIGPVNLICIRRTLAYGPINGFLSGLGAALGDGIFAAVTAFGLTAISQWITGYSHLLQLIGGLMLLGFGLHVFRADVTSLGDQQGTPRDGSASLVHALLSTFALTITNPATLFGFAALYAGIGGLARGSATFLDAALTVLGVVAGSTAWWFMLTTIVGIFHHLIDPKVMRNINHAFGVVVTGFGLLVLGNLAVAVLG